MQGLFIETPADCAVRELKEETGIKLDADDIKNCAQIDLPQIDNLNPHKGKLLNNSTCSLKYRYSTKMQVKIKKSGFYMYPYVATHV